jgi:hypothetical protein
MAAQYEMPVGALPALATGTNDNPAPAIAMGDATSVQHVVAARLQHENRKRLAGLNPPLAAEDEVVASKRRKHFVQSANFDGPVPAWALQMQQQMQQMQQQLQQQLQQMDRRIQQESDRSMNRSLRTTLQPMVRVIRLVDGNPPPAASWFPAHYHDLHHATQAQITALLGFYQLPVVGNLEVKRERLQAHLGVFL